MNMLQNGFHGNSTAVSNFRDGIGKPGRIPRQFFPETRNTERGKPCFPRDCGDGARFAKGFPGGTHQPSAHHKTMSTITTWNPYHELERLQDRVLRAMRLTPAQSDQEGNSLRVSLPKSEEKKPKHIEVNVE
jgi:hypothetical protein